MENTTWKSILFGNVKVFNNKYEFKHYSGKIVSFDSKEELEDYIQEYFDISCNLSQTS